MAYSGGLGGFRWGGFWLGGYASKCISLHTFRRFSLRRKSSRFSFSLSLVQCKFSVTCLVLNVYKDIFVWVCVFECVFKSHCKLLNRIKCNLSKLEFRPHRKIFDPGMQSRTHTGFYPKAVAL